MIVKPSANMKMTSYKKPKTGLYGLAALTVLFGLGIWLFYQNYVQKPSPTKEITNIGNIQPLALPEPALPMAEREAALQASTELTLPSPQAAATTNTTLSEGASAQVTAPLPRDTAPAELAVPTAPVPVTPVPPVATAAAEPVVPNEVANVAGVGRLDFSATQETWVSVIDSNGREIYSKTIFAGSRETVNATLPVDITVGNAGATSLSMNGKSYDLAPYSRNNVAHIKLEK
jgi:cytoskeleton protein RodZ